MEDFSVPKQAWQYQPRGNRNLGRKMKRWTDQIYEPEWPIRIQTIIIIVT
jgi:hypothetical protein